MPLYMLHRSLLLGHDIRKGGTFSYIRTVLQGHALCFNARLRNRVVIGFPMAGLNPSFFFSVCRSASKERKNEVCCGDVRIFTYFDLFSDQFASFFDPTRSSFSIFFQ